LTRRDEEEAVFSTKGLNDKTGSNESSRQRQRQRKRVDTEYLAMIDDTSFREKHE
jgi:hypothetical protein